MCFAVPDWSVVMIPRLAKVAALFAAVILSTGLVSCGGGGSPANPSTPPATTPPVATPTPAPNPPLSATCVRLGFSRATGQEKCPKEGPTFLDELDEAIDQLVRDQPQIFDLNSTKSAGGYKVLSEGAYFVGVIQNLDKMGLCSGLYSEELAIANTHGYSDNFDIIDSDHFIRRGSNSYRSTCYPASFTTPMPPAANTPGCNLPASLSIACSREDRVVFRQAVEDALDQIAREQPEVFDFTETQPGGGPGWYRVRNPGAYTQGVVRILLAKGYCARWDGEEINIKTENISSENYDILTAQGFVRRGDGAYRVTCYPAYF